MELAQVAVENPTEGVVALLRRVRDQTGPMTESEYTFHSSLLSAVLAGTTVLATHLQARALRPLDKDTEESPQSRLKSLWTELSEFMG